MFLNDTEASALKEYLIRELEPICDADPSVLADYVIALLKHDQSDAELRELCLNQLADFLSDISPFVDRLFKALHTKSFISKGSDNQSGQLSNNMQRDASDIDMVANAQPSQSSHHQSEAEEGEMNENDNSPERSFRHGRSSFNRNAARFSPYGNGRGGRGGFGMNGRGGMMRPPFMVPRHMRLGRCFEFDEKGTCSKGDQCKFDHTPLMAPPLPAMMGMGRGFRPPVPGMPPFFPPGMRPPRNIVPGMGPAMNQEHSEMGAAPFLNDRRFVHSTPTRDNDTLVVENIPQDHFSEEAIRTYFGQFGTVVEVSLSPSGPRALVKFASNTEAYTAYKSPDVIFGNRFVKVYFSKQEFDPVKYDERREAQTAAFVEQKKQQILETERRKKEERAKQLLELQRYQDELIAKQIEQQKELMKAMEKPGLSNEDKQQLLATLKSLTQSTEALVVKKATTAELIKNAIPKQDETMDISESAEDVDMTTDAALQDKLKSLQAQAKSMGIDPTLAQSGSSGYNPYRGGFAGRGRGRGMAIRPGSMSLDNRPPKFFLLQVPSNELETIQAHYKSFPGFVSLEYDEASLIGLVTYESRRQAEIAYVRIPKLADLNQMSASWIQPQPSSNGQP